MELINVTDVFENDELVVMKSTYKLEGGAIECIDVGIKNTIGDIEDVTTVKSTIILDEKA